MIGNDIVDLKQIASNWKRPRFLEKVFTQEEQQLICSSENQHQMVWLLWSMKEAAYKTHMQQYGGRFFNPKRLVCELISEDKGIVKIDSDIYFSDSTITEDYIYTIAKRDHNQEVTTSIFRSEPSPYSIQSDVLKWCVLQSISETKNLDVKVLSIKKTEIGVPEVFMNSEKLQIPFSLTHCGRFSGFVF
jgi:phosphopantetheine--protein transferase-like protein